MCLAHYRAHKVIRELVLRSRELSLFPLSIYLDLFWDDSLSVLLQSYYLPMSYLWLTYEQPVHKTFITPR